VKKSNALLNNQVSFEEFQKVWEEWPNVVLDTNCILDLYRYSSDTTEHVLDILKSIKKFIWIPAQVKEEYEKNYRSVIKKARDNYYDVTKQVKQVTTKARNDLEKQFIRYKGFNFPKINELDTIINAKDIVAYKARMPGILLAAKVPHTMMPRSWMPSRTASHTRRCRVSAYLLTNRRR
jgi:galactose-1-phosphate uridylyltransferase